MFSGKLQVRSSQAVLHGVLSCEVGNRQAHRERVVALWYSHTHEAACGPTYEKER